MPPSLSPGLFINGVQNPLMASCRYDCYTSGLCETLRLDVKWPLIGIHKKTSIIVPCHANDLGDPCSPRCLLQYCADEAAYFTNILNTVERQMDSCAWIPAAAT